MKKVLTLLILILISITLVACGEDTQTSGSDNTTSNSSQTEEKSKEVSIGSAFEAGSYEVTVKGLRRGKDYEGNPTVVITFDWTNNSEETTSWMGSMMNSIFQDGAQLETAIMASGIDVDNIMKEVRPGTKLEGIEQGFITTSENELEIEVQAIENMFGDPILIKAEYPTE